MAGGTHPDLSPDEQERLRRMANRNQERAERGESPGGCRNPFAWNDDVILGEADRLTLVARALCILNTLADMEKENTSERWITWGVSGAIAALIKAGGDDVAATLLVSLEALIPQTSRDEWPLAGFTE